MRRQAHGTRAGGLAVVLAALSALLLVLVGCGSSRTAGPTAPTVPPSGAADQLYVSVGDSYAAGYQPTGYRVGGTTTNGFAYQLVGAARAKGYDLRLVNLGCSGARTTSVLHTKGCKHGNLGPGAAPYDGQTQADAAVSILRQHRGGTALITVSLGGNDVTACAAAPAALTCLTDAVSRIRGNLTTLVGRLRAAAGPKVPIVGLTYPDVVLGGYVTGGAMARQLAEISVTAFRSLVNPAIKQAYASAGATFVDITADTGAYGPLSETTTLAPYGTVPVPVARICRLTFSCQYQDIHPRTSGYALISKAIAAALPRHG